MEKEGDLPLFKDIPRNVDDVPDDWMSTISNEEWKEIALKLANLSLQVPYLKSRVLDLVWLICMEDQRCKGAK